MGKKISHLTFFFLFILKLFIVHSNVTVLHFFLPLYRAPHEVMMLQKACKAIAMHVRDENAIYLTL